MRCISSFYIKRTIAAVLLSCFIAGGVSAMTKPAVTERNEPITISVNRTQKGDRLKASRGQQHPNDSKTISVPPKRVPLGCDPAFSPVAAPQFAHIFGRCIA
jgi:hypothetical protein